VVLSHSQFFHPHPLFIAVFEHVVNFYTIKNIFNFCSLLVSQTGYKEFKKKCFPKVLRKSKCESVESAFYQQEHMQIMRQEYPL